MPQGDAERGATVRLTAAVSRREYEALKTQAVHERRSVANMAGQLIGRGLIETYQPGGLVPATKPRAEPPAERPVRLVRQEPSSAGAKKARAATSGKGRKGGRMDPAAPCRHGTEHCRVCGTGRYAT
jgi:hypothetical protein